MDLMSKCVSCLLKPTCGADFESRQQTAVSTPGVRTALTQPAAGTRSFRR